MTRSRWSEPKPRRARHELRGPVHTVGVPLQVDVGAALGGGALTVAAIRDASNAVPGSVRTPPQRRSAAYPLAAHAVIGVRRSSTSPACAQRAPPRSPSARPARARHTSTFVRWRSDLRRLKLAVGKRIAGRPSSNKRTARSSSTPASSRPSNPTATSCSAKPPCDRQRSDATRRVVERPRQRVAPSRESSSSSSERMARAARAADPDCSATRALRGDVIDLRSIARK